MYFWQLDKYMARIEKMATGREALRILERRIGDSLGLVLYNLR